MPVAHATEVLADLRRMALDPSRTQRLWGAEECEPLLVPALLALVEPDERGDRKSPPRWTTMPPRSLTGQLTRQGHAASAPTVGRLLRDDGFSPQGGTHPLEGAQHLDRDVRFRHISEPTADTGWVYVSTDDNTAASAVETIRRRWQARGCLRCPRARPLLITADAGGSHGYRTLAADWRTPRQQDSVTRRDGARGPGHRRAGRGGHRRRERRNPDAPSPAWKPASARRTSRASACSHPTRCRDAPSELLMARHNGSRPENQVEFRIAVN